MKKIKEIHTMIIQIQNLGKIIVLQWIPAHCGIYGNEQADILAKKGTKVKQSIKYKFPFDSIKWVIKNKINNEYNKQLLIENENSRWKELIYNPKVIPETPRKSTVALFKLITGHDCLNKHLHKIGIKNSPNCDLCFKNEEMYMEHLKSCQGLKTQPDIASKYWEARRRRILLSDQRH